MPSPVSRPWHLVVVGLVALLWHLGGAADYVATQMRFEPYVSEFPPEWIVYFGGLPTWVNAAWAIGVWVGLLGAILLLLRERAAVLTLAVAAIAMVAATIWLIFLADPTIGAVTGDVGVWVVAGAALASVLLWLYARWMKVAQVLG